MALNSDGAGTKERPFQSHYHSNGTQRKGRTEFGDEGAEEPEFLYRCASCHAIRDTSDARRTRPFCINSAAIGKGVSIAVHFGAQLYRVVDTQHPFMDLGNSDDSINDWIHVPDIKGVTMLDAIAIRLSIS